MKPVPALAIVILLAATVAPSQIVSGRLDVAVLSISDTSISVSVENVALPNLPFPATQEIEVMVEITSPRAASTAWRPNGHTFTLSGLEPLTAVVGTARSRLVSPEVLLNERPIRLQTTVLGQSGDQARQIVRALSDDDYIRLLLKNAEMRLPPLQKRMFDTLLIDTARELRTQRLQSAREAVSREQADVDALP